MKKIVLGEAIGEREPGIVCVNTYNDALHFDIAFKAPPGKYRLVLEPVEPIRPKRAR